MFIEYKFCIAFLLSFSILGEKTGFVQVGPKKYFFPSSYKEQANNYYNFQVRSDDIWVVSFPRSGKIFLKF